MAITLKDLKVSANKKRVDVNVEKRSLFGSNFDAKLRILAWQEIEEVEDAIEFVIESKSKWKASKESARSKFSHSMAGFGISGNAYILSFESKE